MVRKYACPHPQNCQIAQQAKRARVVYFQKTLEVLFSRVNWPPPPLTTPLRLVVLKKLAKSDQIGRSFAIFIIPEMKDHKVGQKQKFLTMPWRKRGSLRILKSNHLAESLKGSRISRSEHSLMAVLVSFTSWTLIPSLSARTSSFTSLSGHDVSLDKELCCSAIAEAWNTSAESARRPCFAGKNGFAIEELSVRSLLIRKSFLCKSRTAAMRIRLPTPVILIPWAWFPCKKRLNIQNPRTWPSFLSFSYQIEPSSHSLASIRSQPLIRL